MRASGHDRTAYDTKCEQHTPIAETTMIETGVPAQENAYTGTMSADETWDEMWGGKQKEAHVYVPGLEQCHTHQQAGLSWTNTLVAAIDLLL